MRVFISSVEVGYEGYRDVAARAVDASGHQPIRIEKNPAVPLPPQADCTLNIDDCDVVLFLFGRRYGTPDEETGKSPVHEEWDHAHAVGKTVLVFRERFNAEEEEPLQTRFLSELGDWRTGYRWAHYENEVDLAVEIVRALRDIAEEPNRLRKLPTDCQEHVQALREKSRGMAARVVGLLSGPDAKTHGFLSGIADDPPEWLANTDFEVWEAIASFQRAYDLPGADVSWRRAIEVGSPRAEVILARLALVAAGDENQAAAQEYLAEIPADDPLVAMTRARIDGDSAGAVEAIMGGRLHESDDPHVALFCVLTLMWAHWEQGRPDAAVEVLQQASRRFPDRGWLLYHQANLMLGIADRMESGSQDSRAVLADASDLALWARDLFRNWDGPSHLGAALAMRALWAMQEPASAIPIAHLPPDGEATPSEAASADVQSELNRALLVIGRAGEISSHPLGDAGPFEREIVTSMQSHALDDSTALPKARRALSLANGESEVKQALHALALCGEVDEEAMADLSASDQALLRGVAALHGAPPDPQQAAALLSAHQSSSPFHVTYFADALLEGGDADGAIAALRRGASRFDNMRMLARAADLLASPDADDTRLGEAVSVAEAVLARNSPSSIRHEMRRLLIDIACRREDWRTMESYALAMTSEFPDDEDAKWQELNAIFLQGECQRAWTRIATHSLAPHSPQTAQLMAAIAQGAEKSDHDIQRLLRLAEPFRDHEEAAAQTAIAALLAADEQTWLSDATLTQIREFTGDFLIRHPHSILLGSFDIGSPEDAMAIIGDLAQPRPDGLNELVARIRYGLAPYGLLRIVGGQPYTLSLLDASAGFITAVPADAGQRLAEKAAAVAALHSSIAVDTSAIATCLRSNIEMGQLSDWFTRIIVGDAQIHDARQAVIAASSPVVGTVGHDPLLDRPVLEAISETQQAEMREMAERALALLDRWETVSVGVLPPLDAVPEEAGGTWTSATRVAQSRQCALWADDLFLRTIAASAGIPAFSTWALLEALAEQPSTEDQIDMVEIGIGMLRARIADIPLALSDLDQSAIEPDDICFSNLLARPTTWSQQHSAETTDWYQTRVSALADGQRPLLIPQMLRAAAFGLGAACPDPENMVETIGRLLAATIWRTEVISPTQVPPEMVAWLTTAARYAVLDLDPTAGIDPLSGAVRYLCEIQAAHMPHEDAARNARSLFAVLQELAPVDWGIVVETIQTWLLQSSGEEDE